MTNQEQINIALAAIERIKVRVLAKSEQWPQEWDGIEVCVLIEKAAIYVTHVHTGTSKSLTRRVHNATNDIIVNNLV